MKKLLVAILSCLLFNTLAHAAAPDLSIGSASGFAGSSISVPITADYAAATPGDAQLTITYDPNLLTPTNTPVSPGTADSGWSFVSNVKSPGILNIAMFNPAGLTISGSAQQIATINFTVNTTPGAPTIASPNIDLSAAILGNTNITNLTNGNFTLNLLGDVNGDGKVTGADAILISQYVVGITTLTAAQQAAAEVDHTSTVTIYDAWLISELVAGVINHF
jgi:hypothetical protein